MAAHWKNILVPIDFTDHSLVALERGLSLAEKLGSRLHVLHAAHDPTELPGFPENKKSGEKVAQKVEEATKKRFDTFLEECKLTKAAKAAKVEVKPHLRSGNPLRVILETITEVEADLVIIGARGQTDLSHLLLGSQAQRILQLVSVPVMVVKAAPKKRDK